MAAALFGTVSELETSVAGSICNRIVTDLTSFVVEFPATKIHIRGLSLDKNLVAPYIIVRPAPETHNPAEGAIGRSVNHYRTMITVAQAGNRDLIENLADQLLWREMIERIYKQQVPAWSLPRNATIRRTIVFPGEPFIKDAFMRMVNAQFILIDAEVQEPLGPEA